MSGSSYKAGKIDNFIENNMQITMTLKREWFDKIKTGSKTIEYREAKHYWDIRLNKPIKSILFRNGYSRSAPEILADVMKIERVNGLDTDLRFDGMVYAIHLTNVRVAENA